MFIYLNRKAQSTAEYVVLLGIAVGAIIAMQTYVKRGLQEKVRNAVDYVDNAGSNVFTGGQYEPYYMTGSNFNTDADSRETEGYGSQGTTRTTDERTTRSGEQIIGAVPNQGG